MVAGSCAEMMLVKRFCVVDVTAGTSVIVVFVCLLNEVMEFDCSCMGPVVTKS